ncbi:MAG: hypothetical protein J6T01_02260 [Kiritimatiellae bacterium]|nr:hypothetical protein [Kiritimatiellia bacterium]
MISRLLPYITVFAASLLATLVLTPLVREINRGLGMVDEPGGRRINTRAVPRGGGAAIAIGVNLSYLVFVALTGRPVVFGLPDAVSCKIMALSLAIALLGLGDDKFSLPPAVKLAGQVSVAFLVWWWAGLGFTDIWPSIPAWLDCAMTVFWITGAVNAFNLIDGLDGLASGIALIATVGMAGGVFFVREPQATLFYFAFAGGLLGFLRYNYNPASVFLGDCGSMYIGFMLSTLPLASHVPNSFLVSVGVPLLAMGVPIFDTSLAILRRALRRMIAAGAGTAGVRVMSPDSDHLHHRLLRRTGLNQRKTAWILYGVTAAAVAVGLVAMSLESRAGGLWLGAMAVAAVVMFKDATVELFDAGRLLNRVAHTRDRGSLRRIAVWTIPFYVIFDITALTVVYLVCSAAMGVKQDEHLVRSYLPIRVASTFAFLVFFRAYRTVWSRAVGSNYFRLFLACALGSVAGSVFIYYWPTTASVYSGAMTFVYTVIAFGALLGMRLVRVFVRDLFYSVDCARLRNRKDVSRILVYGSGLRYASFRRELVRTTAANDRMIVGLIDDNVYLKGKYIGGVRIHGTINDAPEVINALNVDAVVIACDITDKWLKVVKALLAPSGVKVTKFSFSEKPA